MSKVPNTIPADDQNEIALLIDGERFKYWESGSIELSIDKISQFTLTGPFQKENQLFRDAFRPASYKDIALYVGGELLKQGTLVTPKPSFGPDSNTVSVSGYGIFGVMNDCNVSSDDYPLEFFDLDLRQIATTLAEAFFLDTPVFTTDPGAPFDQVSLSVTTKPLNFLIKLAKQRGILITDNEKGQPLFQKATTAKPIAELTQGEPPLLEGSAVYDGQKLFTIVIGQTPPVIGLGAERISIVVPFVKGFRPFVFQVEDSEGADLRQNVLVKAGHMVGSSINLSLTVQGWRDPNGDLWRPNTIIKVTAPGAMVYNATEYLIKKVTFSRKDSDITDLDLVLPGSYSGIFPEVMPWEE